MVKKRRLTAANHCRATRCSNTALNTPATLILFVQGIYSGHIYMFGDNGTVVQLLIVIRFNADEEESISKCQNRIRGSHRVSLRGHS